MSIRNILRKGEICSGELTGVEAHAILNSGIITYYFWLCQANYQDLFCHYSFVICHQVRSFELSIIEDRQSNTFLASYFLS